MECKCERIVLALLEKPFMHGCMSASLYLSKNHMSLADLLMVGPRKFMVGNRP